MTDHRRDDEVGEVEHLDGRRERGIITDRVKVALAVSDPKRNRWPDEPEECYEDKERDGFGRNLRDADGRRLRYDDTGEAE